MKVNITDSKKDFIEGCVNLDIANYDAKFFEEVPQSSCELLIINECLGCLSYEESVKALQDSIIRIAKGGKISLALIDFESISVSFTNGSMNSESVSEILKAYKSVLNVYEVKEILTKGSINIVQAERKNNLLLINGIKA